MTTFDFVPDWAKGIVWYQIFPERFWNGDPAKDPRLEDQAGSWPHDQGLPWQVHPWTADWYELQPYERANGKSLWHNLQRRRYGGDLQGILDRPAGLPTRAGCGRALPKPGVCGSLIPQVRWRCLPSRRSYLRSRPRR